MSENTEIKTTVIRGETEIELTVTASYTPGDRETHPEVYIRKAVDAQGRRYELTNDEATVVEYEVLDLVEKAAAAREVDRAENHAHA